IDKNSARALTAEVVPRPQQFEAYYCTTKLMIVTELSAAKPTTHCLGRRTEICGLDKGQTTTRVGAAVVGVAKRFRALPADVAADVESGPVVDGGRRRLRDGAIQISRANGSGCCCKSGSGDREAEQCGFHAFAPCSNGGKPRYAYTHPRKLGTLV